jgi:hypothetical protein
MSRQFLLGFQLWLLALAVPLAAQPDPETRRQTKGAQEMRKADRRPHPARKRVARSVRTQNIVSMSAPRVASQSPAVWTVLSQAHPTESGQVIDFLYGGKIAARFVYGDAQPKPYLHVYADDGVTLLTKGGPTGTYPHHRGIFIGWNQIRIGGGQYDLWHMVSGTMRVVHIERLVTLPDVAILVAQIEWRAGTTGTGALLLTEERTIAVSKPEGAGVQIDCHFALRAEQNLMLDGDLQHAGVHFRAPQEVFQRDAETSYLNSPDGVVAGSNLRWCRLLFPLGSRWFTSLQMNAPQNPVEELSIREYGRFGYFFRRTMQTRERLSLAYRFVVKESEAPANPPQQSATQIAQSRAACDAAYNGFADFQSADFDGDAQTTADEMIAATNPFFFDSRFKILTTAQNGTGAPFVEFPWLPTRIYRVWQSDDLSLWQEIQSPQFTFPQVDVARWTDIPPFPGDRFYRVTIE